MDNHVEFTEILGDNLANIISSFSTYDQIVGEIESLVSQFTDMLSANYSLLTIQSNSFSGIQNLFTKSYGMSPEHTRSIINLMRKEDHYQNLGEGKFFDNYQLIKPMEEHAMGRKVELFGTKQLIHIPVVSGNKNADFYLFFTRITQFTDVTVQKIQNFVEIIMLALETQLELHNLRTKEAIAKDYYFKNFDPIFIINKELFIKDVNAEAAILIGRDLSTNPNLMEYIKDADKIDMIRQYIRSTNTSKKSEVIELNWDLSDNLYSDEEEVTIEVGLRLLEPGEPRTQILLAGRIKEKVSFTQINPLIEDQLGEVIPQLSNYPQMMIEDKPNAIEFGMTHIFPAGFFFTANEKTGPIVVTSSPQEHIDLAAEGAIKLMAGLPTHQIVEHGYVTGSTPWDIPSGEMHWIAFSRVNEVARGGLEIHSLGIVTKHNLLLARPSFNQAMLGILLGGMNSYLNILDEDDVDLSTEPFFQDRNFSTLSLIQEVLDELRLMSCEVLAAYINNRT